MMRALYMFAVLLSSATAFVLHAPMRPSVCSTPLASIDVE